MRVIICGGGIDAPEDTDTAVAAALDELHVRRRFTVVGLRAGVELKAPDAPDVAPVVTPEPTDMLADVWSENTGIDRILFPATASRGAFADHDRNRLMLTTLRPELVVVIPGGPDTANLAHQARGMKIKVVELTPSPEQERGDAPPAQGSAQPQGSGAPPPPGGRGRPSAPRPARARAKAQT